MSQETPGTASKLQADAPVKIKRAVLSVYDKTGITELAQALHDSGAELISTGGTMAALKDAGLPVTTVESLTGYGSMLGGRLKTLHPKLMGGILGRPGLDSDARELSDAEIEPVQLVVVNLYPFSEAADDPNATRADAIELIDVGGPTMIRAAAKNHTTVAVVCDQSDYSKVAQEIRENDGSLSAATRRHLATKAFATTAAYDARIAAYLAADSASETGSQFPEIWVRSFVREGELRYGENPHQGAALYRALDGSSVSLASAPVAGRKALSYNNLSDLDAAWRMAVDFDEPFAAVFKHANPCGAALGDDIRAAYIAAHATDPLSAYGSIVALNRTVDLACAEALNDTTFIECVLAPGYDPDALQLMSKRKARRYITVPTMDLGESGQMRFRELVGGLLVQNEDTTDVNLTDLKVVTQKAPTEDQMIAMLFARKVVKHAKSNAIALVQGRAAVGIGSGQTSRVDAVRSAIERAGKRTTGAVLASDAFFPMRDGPELAAKAGVAAVIQPGGSKRDEEVISACDEYGVAMVFSGLRNFRH